MNIVIASDTYYPNVNGASYSTQRFAHALQKKGHQVSVIAPSQSIFNTIENHDGVTVYGVSSLPILLYSGFRFVLRPVAALVIPGIIKKINPDIVHIQMHFAVSSTTLFSARRKNIPVVATNHFMPENLIHYLPFPHWLKKTIISLAWKDAARIYRKTDVVISPTETAKKVLDKWLDKTNTKSVVLSNGVALDHFHPDHQTKQVVEKYHLPNLPLLLFVGRLDKEKNIDVVLRAFARSAKNFHIVIAGSGSEKKHLDELAASLNIKEHVTFTGFVPNEELPALYAASSGFINAGVAELQGMSVMEAMASGLPVLGARAVALPELVHHGENGYLFEPGNREELAGYMTTLFANEEKRKQMGEKSMEIIQPHRFSNVVIKCEEIYGQLIHV